MTFKLALSAFPFVLEGNILLLYYDDDDDNDLTESLNFIIISVLSYARVECNL